MAQTIQSGYDDIWISSANFNVLRVTGGNSTYYEVIQFVLKRVSDGKLVAGIQAKNLVSMSWAYDFYMERSPGSNTDPLVEFRDASGNVLSATLAFKKRGATYGSSSPIYIAFEVPTNAKTVRFYGATDFSASIGPDAIFFRQGDGSTSYQGGFKTTSTDISSYINKVPTLTLTSPANNQTLAEGNNYAVEGSASDSDSGNVMTVKYKINNGTARALASGVSDGSSPLSFAKTLTYSNKRIWDGSTDVYGADLAENTDHTLTVWSEDDQGGKSAEVTRKFRVVWNRPPTIDGSNSNLGTIQQPPSKTYTVTEPESDSFTITEKINGTVISSFAGVAGRQETVTIPHDQWIRLDLDTPHALTVEATDSKGLTSIRTFTFTRTETHIEFMLNFDNPDVQGHFILDGMPERVLVTLERYIPEGAEIESVKVCNNALDAEPTWEDATIAVKGNRGFLFNNTNKTAENWAINIWVIIAKGTATERARLNGYGGAFD